MIYRHAYKKMLPYVSIPLGTLVFCNIYAQEVPLKTEANNPIQRVEISGEKIRDERRHSNTSRTIVSKEDIAKYSDSTVSDVLRRVPGVTVSGVQGRAGEIRMNGLGGGYTQILINGEPTPPGFSLDSLSPNLVEKIEVLRVATADLSAQSIAGTINIILRETARSSQRELKTSLYGYNKNHSGSLDAKFTDRLDNFSYSIDAGINHEENEWPSLIEQNAYDSLGNPNLKRNTNKLEFSKENILSLAPRMNWKLGNGDSIHADMLFRYRDTTGGTVDTRATFLGTPALYAANDLQAQNTSKLLRTKLNWSHNLADEAKIDVKLGANYANRLSKVKFFGFDAVHNTVLDENTDSNATDKSLTFSGKYRAAYMENHSISLGWESELSQRLESRIQRQRAPAGYPALNLNENYNAKVTRLASFAQDEWDIRPGLSSYLGLRWEGLQTRSAGDTTQTVVNQSSVFSPVIQLLWKLPESKNDQVRFALSRTYKAPTTRNLMPRRFVANDNTATTPDLQGNPDLRPELAWGVDLSYEHYTSFGGMFSITGNLRKIQNVILQELYQANAVWISTPVNHGSALTKGIEIEGKLNLAKLDRTLPDVDLRSNVSWNWSAVQAVPGPKNYLGKQIPFNFNFGVDYRSAALPLTLGGNFGYQGAIDVRESIKQSGGSNIKRSLDIYGLWKFNARNQMRLAITNVLHQNNIGRENYFDSSENLQQVTTTPTQTTIRLVWEAKL